MVYAPADPSALPEKDRSPGTYVALDCEMVGVGPDGAESVLARVSVVNFQGAVLLDTFVRPRERVTDWRTRYSGVRSADMKHAQSFTDAQSSVADLLVGRVLIGHAVHNDLHALLLTHPRAKTRDTQFLAYRHGQVRSKRPALRDLVRDMLGLTIQDGEHSSVTDARATMAIYRLHRKQWDRAYNSVPVRVKLTPANTSAKAKREREQSDGEADNATGQRAGEVRIAKSGAVQRKGTSSGLSTVIKYQGKSNAQKPEKSARGSGDRSGHKEWWKDLGGSGVAKGSKGTVKLSATKV